MKSLFLLVAFACLGVVRAGAAADVGAKPNVIFILADDMGVGDAGCFGQTKILTPNIDRIAAEGIKFTQSYCGTSVCAPCRCALMTGMHIGHAPIRANREIKPEGQMPVPKDTLTVAKLMKQAGYKTAIVGKWGLGFPGSGSEPIHMGFDHFFGYNCQAKAHDYYPPEMWLDDARIKLDGKTYSHDLMEKDALQWLRANGASPFFLYVPFTIPHAKIEVPDLGPYADKPWSENDKRYASMITRMDGSIGKIMALVKELGIDDKTLVFFASDNGPNPPFLKEFNSAAGLRGIKRDMYEGGIRSPTVARWPGHVPAGKVSADPWVFYDFLPTMAELIGAKVPDSAKIDGISIMPALLGGALPKRDYLYWELHEQNHSQQAVRFGDWKAVKRGPSLPIELYNLKDDPTEKTDIGAKRPDELKKAAEYMKAAHVDSPDWPMKDAPKGAKAGKGAKKPVDE